MAWILPLAQVALPLLQNMMGSQNRASGTSTAGGVAMTPDGTPVSVTSGMLGPLMQNQAAVGRAEVSRIQAGVNPQLEQILGLLSNRSLQIQATTEHQELVRREAFRNGVMQRLQAIQAAVGAGGGAGGGSSSGGSSSRY